MLHAPLSTRRSRNDASGLLPKLCGSKDTHSPYQFRRFGRLFDTSSILLSVHIHGEIKMKWGGGAVTHCLFSNLFSLSCQRVFVNCKSGLLDQETDTSDTLMRQFFPSDCKQRYKPSMHTKKQPLNLITSTLLKICVENNNLFAYKVRVGHVKNAKNTHTPADSSSSDSADRILQHPRG